MATLDLNNKVWIQISALPLLINFFDHGFCKGNLQISDHCNLTNAPSHPAHSLKVLETGICQCAHA